MSNRLFDRRIAVIVGGFKVEGDRIQSGLRISGLRIGFNVNQSLDGADNTAAVTLYNLNESSRGRLMNLTKPQFIIEAGFENTIAAVFKGIAQTVTNKRASPGFITEVSASDGGEEGKRIVNAALAPGASIATVLETIASKMKVNAQRALKLAKEGKFSLAFGTIKKGIESEGDRLTNAFTNGVVLSGSCKVEMDRLARSLGVRWCVRDGELVVLNAGETTDEDAVLLHPETGLIGSPERVIDKKRPGKLIVKARSLVQPTLRPGRRVEIASTEINGSFRVESVTHFGDTHGPDWYSDCVAIAVR